MYLVLTALLALQVSNAVLEKFIFINKTLEKAANESAIKNAKTLASIEGTVGEKGNRGNDVKVLEKAKAVRQRTEEIITQLNTLKSDMAILTGAGDDDGYDENGNLIGAKDYDKVGTMMVQQGRGEELRTLLNDYATFLIMETGEENAADFPPIANDADKIDQFKNDPNQKMKKFPILFFEDTPTAAGMATVSQFENEVLAYEQKALEDLAEQVGAKDVDFDQIFPLIRPDQKIVGAGAEYNAQMFIAASSSSLTPEMAVNGKEVEIKTMEGGIKYGVVSFRTSPGAYNAKTGLARKTFKAEIKLNDSTYVIDQEYFVVQPVIQVSSRAASALWRNCGNELSVQVPQLGTSYNPNITGSNAAVVKGGGAGEITVVPSSNKKVVLTVNNGGARIGTKEFTVKEIPLPTYDLTSRNRPIDLENGVKASDFRALEVNAIAEPNFKADVPKDAGYKVREVEVKLTRANDPIKVQTFKRDKINLSAFAQQARKGDLMIIKVIKTTRNTYLKKTEQVPTRNQIYKVQIL